MSSPSPNQSRNRSRARGNQETVDQTPLSISGRTLSSGSLSGPSSTASSAAASRRSNNQLPQHAAVSAVRGVTNNSITSPEHHRVVTTGETDVDDDMTSPISSNSGFNREFAPENSDNLVLLSHSRDASPGRDAQASLQERYIHQMLFGCPAHAAARTCPNIYCAAYPSFPEYTTQEIAMMAQSLSRLGTGYLCPSNNPDARLEGSSAVSSIAAAAARAVQGQDKKASESSSTPSRKRQSTGNGDHDIMNLDPTSAANVSGTRTTAQTEFSMQLDTLQKAVDNCRKVNDFSELSRWIYAVFSVPERLAASFTDAKSKRPSAEQARSAYRIFMSQCPTSISSTVHSATLHLLDKLQLTSSPFENTNLLGIFVILLENPLLLDTASHSSQVERICRFIATLKFSICPILPEYLLGSQIDYTPPETTAKSEAERWNWKELLKQKEHRSKCTKAMQGWVSIVQHFLSMRIYSLIGDTQSAIMNSDEGVQISVKCLEVFYEWNNFLKLLPIDEFYNDAVNEHLEIKEDFPHWKAKEGFSFCNYPFVLTASTKSDILKVESMVQMRHELQDAFFRAMFIGVNSPYLVLEIRRTHIVRDALYQLESKKPQDLKKQLKIQFVGEEAVDEGGVQKEFFQLIIREIFDSKYAIFRQNETSKLYWFAYNPHFDDAAAEEIRLVGRLFGLAIYNGVILDVHLPTALYKKLNPSSSVDLDIGLAELQEFDPLLAKNLKTLLDFNGDVQEVFQRTFEIEMEVMGQHFPVELKPGGANIPLTNANRQEFVDLYVDFIFNKSIARQYEAFQEGFNMVCQGSAISLFRPEEVQLLICGSSDLDFDALKSVTTYDGGFSLETPVIKYFWEIVLQFTEEQKKRLLFFATGTDRAPIGGLGKLAFVIAKNGPDSDRLPSSHTCFNVLLLPEYQEKEKLKERLLTAIQNSEGFGMI